MLPLPPPSPPLLILQPPSPPLSGHQDHHNAWVPQGGQDEDHPAFTCNFPFVNTAGGISVLSAPLSPHSLTSSASSSLPSLNAQRRLVLQVREAIQSPIKQSSYQSVTSSTSDTSHRLVNQNVSVICLSVSTCVVIHTSIQIYLFLYMP